MVNNTEKGLEKRPNSGNMPAVKKEMDEIIKVVPEIAGRREALEGEG